MSAAVERKPGPKARMYTDEEVELGLTASVAMHGNDRRASRELAKQGVKIPAGTLRGWRETHAERYLEIRERVLPGLKVEMAERLERVVHEGSELQMEFLKRMRDNLDDLDPRDLGKNFQQAAIGTGIASQRAGDLRGDVSVVEHRNDPTSTLSGLRRMGLLPEKPIDADAEEVQDAEVVASPSPVGSLPRHVPEQP